MTGVEPAAFRLGGGPSILLRYMDLYKIFSVGRLLQQALRRRTLYPAELQKHKYKAGRMILMRSALYNNLSGKKNQVLFSNKHPVETSL
ncbi:hypothetical protein CLOBOL_01540 [Enterocloster bolteae ATCC BAA-613]|uniref:Uncharacterized protein n=1 Tax=Enterocloster bolteae (strain ATCC BAA-613 / DSM 15670 / CCUG 46953 / JCM 12243 / WAL 16351) TaxID=411902 RepID=A8RL92_ENTBW|nr:hypothetical protein CLOBOL_01540 [Enterocloster bolteae ATCC BAA-613]